MRPMHATHLEDACDRQHSGQLALRLAAAAALAGLRAVLLLDPHLDGPLVLVEPQVDL